jgi:hypothetical protein
MKNKTNIPECIEIEVYWVEDDEGNIQFEEDEMRDEFERKMKELKEEYKKV